MIEVNSLELATFLKSNLYKKFCEVCHARIAVIKDDFCTAKNFEDVARLQGELRGVTFWLRFPEEFALAVIEQEKRDAAAKA